MNYKLEKSFHVLQCLLSTLLSFNIMFCDILFLGCTVITNHLKLLICSQFFKFREHRIINLKNTVQSMFNTHSKHGLKLAVGFLKGSTLIFPGRA